MYLTPVSIRSNFHRLQPRVAWAFRDAKRKEMNSHSHGYHRYPAKFIPQIVRQLIKTYAPIGNEIICDPFGGCGTTLVEAKLSGRKSIGFDINPVAKLITETKVTPINPDTLLKFRVEFLRNYEADFSINTPHNSRIDYWFDPKTILTLDKIYFNIKKISNPKIKRFFLCAFSHNLKNSSRWLMKSIKPQIDPVKTIVNPFDSFLRHLESMIRKNEEFYQELSKSKHLSISTLMKLRDSTKKLPLQNNAIDLIITSPPYVTSYEYADLHQLSLLWFGDDPNDFKKWHKFSSVEFNEFRKQFIGTSYKNERNGSFDSVIAEKIIISLEKVDRPLAIDVANYFSDMKKAFTEMYRILKVGGKAAVIIGNTNLRNVEIFNAEVATEQMANLGFKKVDFIKREILNKSITSWRDVKTGKFTNLTNPDKKRIYASEYIIVMEK